MSESGHPVWLLTGSLSTLRPRLKEKQGDELKWDSSQTLSSFSFTSIALKGKAGPSGPISVALHVSHCPVWLGLLPQLPPSRLV